MDMQGTPIGSSNQGSKNTSDPSARYNSKQENPGPIASDSLAAESSRTGGVFSENRNSEPQLVKGSSSNFANTDTSSATTLAAAPYAAQRESKAAWNADELNGPGGRKYPEGAGEQESQQESYKPDEYSGGQEPPESNENLAKSNTKSGNNTKSVGEGTSSTDSSRGDSGESSTKNNFPPAVAAPKPGKPKGTNITEGAFDDDDPRHNASFTADIGTDNDPGRLAEATFQKRDAQVSGATGPKQTDVTADGQYDVLESEQAL